MKISMTRILLVLIIFCFTACNKPVATNTGTPVEKYFEDNVLNRDFIVNFASDNGADITANYSSYVFKMTKTDFYHGPAEARIGTTVYTGTWRSNDDYSKLVITLPTSPAAFIFLNREWRFTSKALPQLKLAPWGSSDPLILHMLRQ